ncbi:hypothetical protein DFH07DRAFT_768137 [Mycena maculata]|uniref:Uncharacterized protein n=1 Tax=Mycena maculata TaxID=230809 RepID=A0AAD7JYK0_9AGAR|nr:hypothetical protein DFH07DRAFT_768137 [Mycena maculata]
MSGPMVPDDPSRCSGREKDNSQCICKRCEAETIVEGRTLCVDCGHIKTAHPQEGKTAPMTVASLIRGYQDAGKFSGAPKASGSSGASAGSCLDTPGDKSILRKEEDIIDKAIEELIEGW